MSDSFKFPELSVERKDHIIFDKCSCLYLWYYSVLFMAMIFFFSIKLCLIAHKGFTAPRSPTTLFGFLMYILKSILHLFIQYLHVMFEMP